MAARSANTAPATEPPSGFRWVVGGVCLLLLALVLAVFRWCDKPLALSVPCSSDPPPAES